MEAYQNEENGVRSAQKGEKETKEQRENRLGYVRKSFNTAYNKKEKEGTLTEEDIKIAKLYEELDKMYAKNVNMENYEEYAKWCEENGSLPKKRDGVKAAKEGEEETEEQRENRLAQVRYTFFCRAYKKKEKEGTLTEEDIKIAELYKELDRMYAKSTQMKNYKEYAKWCEEKGKLPKNKEGVKAAKKGKEETKEQRENRLAHYKNNFNTAYKKKEKEGKLTEEDIKIAQLYKALDEQYKKKKTTRDLAQAVKDVPITEAEQANEYLETIVNQKEKEGVSHIDE